MSTRSGKRLHNSLHENFVSVVDQATENSMFCKTVMKTRSKRLKENMEDEEHNCASKKRKNYVAYPGNNDADTVTAPRGKTRKSQKHILQEHDINKIIKEVDSEDHDECTVPKKTGRLTRQMKKLNEDMENAEFLDVSNKKNRKIILKEVNGMDSTNTTNKKVKKKKQVITLIENKVEDTEATIITKKKSKKKKKGKKTSNTCDIFITNNQNKSLNKSGMSVDSFHSAAGSPASERDINTSIDRRRGTLLSSGTTSQDIFMSLDEEISCVQPVQQTRKCKTSIKADAIVDGNKQKYEDEACNTLLINNDENIDIISDKPKWSIKPDGKTVGIINTPNKEITNMLAVQPAIDRSFVKDNKTPNSSVSNVSRTINVTDSFSTSANVKEVIDTVELSNSAKKQRRSRRLSHLDPETPSGETKLSINKTKNDKKSLDRTFENIAPKLVSTFDKQDEKFPAKTNPDTTFDKFDEQITSKSSLISSDSELNGTYNKTNDISRVSITSDESKTENIINTTPVLIESSLDNTQLEGTPMKTDAKEAQTTPLKREGTFTKDDTDNITTPLPEITNTSSGSVAAKTPKKDSLTRTPDKGTPLGTPGSTPFPFSKTSQKKSVLNVTHSIEKASRSSLAECAPRTTKVMFCSPIDFPLPTTESKRRIVKSSVKGSNKSFVFDSSECGRGSPAQGRKRSFTHEEGGERAKRSRLADDLLQSVERLSRPRTSSATGKLGSSTPGKKPATPSRPRTKLPNFAALHQKQFAKMESLDECQERKARRAKQLLVPTGSVAVLDRSSPKATESPRKSKEPKSKKTDPELKQGNTYLPSYTRFGFKMNIAGVVNPFIVPPKEPTTVVKPRETKPNGANTRNTLPSRTGGTLVRKDVAKQIIMREKSFNALSSKCDSKRTQNRTIIKGVRTNRRFELQMKMRNVDA